jgi:hypothetical protein
MTISSVLIISLGLRSAGTAFVLDAFPWLLIAWMMTASPRMCWLASHHYDLS